MLQKLVFESCWYLSASLVMVLASAWFGVVLNCVFVHADSESDLDNIVAAARISGKRLMLYFGSW